MNNIIVGFASDETLFVYILCVCGGGGYENEICY